MGAEYLNTKRNTGTRKGIEKEKKERHKINK